MDETIYTNRPEINIKPLHLTRYDPEQQPYLIIWHPPPKGPHFALPKQQILSNCFEHGMPLRKMYWKIGVDKKLCI